MKSNVGWAGSICPPERWATLRSCPTYGTGAASCSCSFKPLQPRRAPQLSAGSARRGAAGCRATAEGEGSPSAVPCRKRGAQGLSRLGVAFLLDTFLWPRKEKYLGRGSENPHSNWPSRSDSTPNAPSSIPNGDLEWHLRHTFLRPVGWAGSICPPELGATLRSCPTHAYFGGISHDYRNPPGR